MRIHRIFWKIFLAFWLASLLILGVTSFVIISSLESTNIKERHKEFLEAFAINVAERYELLGESTTHRDLGKLFKNSALHREMVRRRPIVIADENGKAIFSSKFREKPPHHKKIRFSVVSSSGTTYTVQTYIGPPPRFLIDAIRRINLLQFLLILVASTVVSFILSWSFSRPLKKLGRYSRQFAEGEEHSSIDKNLLIRGDEIGDLARDIHFMSDQVETNIRNQKQLLHDVSHELRAPLARLQAIAGIVQQKSPEISVDIERIHRECDDINNLIQQILNYSRLDHQNMKKEVIDIVEFVEEEIQKVDAEFASHPIDFKHSLTDAKVSTNGNILGRALGNILRNACKYSPVEKQIDVDVSRLNEDIVIQVRDYGLGVKEVERDKLLMPFYRSGNRMHSDGHGLGLSIAKRAMEKLQGTIELANHEEGGLVVTLRFPDSVSG